MNGWKKIYNVDISKWHEPEDKDRVLGSEVPLWSEMNNEFNLPVKIFPRGAAMSFRLWSPEVPEKIVKVPEMLIKHQYRLRENGIPSDRITQRYCEQHIHHCFGKNELDLSQT